MPIRRMLDSDVDQITQKAIQGVNAFIAAYLDDEPASPPPRLAVGALPKRKAAKPAVRKPRRTR